MLKIVESENFSICEKYNPRDFIHSQGLWPRFWSLRSGLCRNEPLSCTLGSDISCFEWPLLWWCSPPPSIRLGFRLARSLFRTASICHGLIFQSLVECQPECLAVGVRAALRACSTISRHILFSFPFGLSEDFYLFVHIYLKRRAVSLLGEIRIVVCKERCSCSTGTGVSCG
jgi:hypothetical protein